MLDRDEDMITSGWRHPFLGRYKVAFSSDGLVQAVEVDLYNNAGHTMDLSFSVMERAMFHSDGSYKVPNLRARGHCCKTNLPSNTAFRGFGGPQGLMVAESWIEKIAMKLGLSTEEVRQRNLYKEGELTHFNQKLVNCTLSRCWDECSKMAGFNQLRAEVDQFNANNRWKKRGLAMIPVKFGIAFTAVHLNQNGALINVYTDGSVLDLDLDLLVSVGFEKCPKLPFPGPCWWRTAGLRWVRACTPRWSKSRRTLSGLITVR